MWLENLVAALAGAFVGAILGYLLSYRLWIIQGRQEREERRKRLMRILQVELARIDRSPSPKFDFYLPTITSPIHIGALRPLIEVAGDLSDAVVRLLMDLDGALVRYNAFAGVIPPDRQTGLGDQVHKDLNHRIAEHRHEVIAAAEALGPHLNIPR